MTESLEQVAKPEEQPKPSSEKEQVEVTSKASKDATLGKPITETEEYKKAQSGWDKQITLSKAGETKALAETERLRQTIGRMDASFQKLESLYEKQIGDQDPEALEGYKRAKSQATWEVERDRREADFVARESDLAKGIEANRLALRAFEIAQETGAPIDLLTACVTEREMELVAKLYQKPKEEPKPEPTPKIDPAVSTAKAVGTSHLSPDEKLARGFREKSK